MEYMIQGKQTPRGSNFRNSAENVICIADKAEMMLQVWRTSVKLARYIQYGEPFKNLLCIYFGDY